MGAARWLNTDEMRLWRNFIETANSLFADLDIELQQEQSMTLGDYEVLVYLCESDEGQMRMCDLAAELRLSPSGLTRRLDGLVKGGMVARQPWDVDRRVSLAVLTPLGHERLVAAAPGHVAGVRRHLLDHLSTTQIKQMAAGFEALASGRTTAAAETD
jgi:DNA-binding MarR family transcriptional regulator